MNHQWGVLGTGGLALIGLNLPARRRLVHSPATLVNALQVSHKSVAAWLRVFERLYAIFRLPPFGAPRIRAVKKEQKHYHLDWSLVPSESARFPDCDAWQISAVGTKDYLSPGGIRVAPALTLLGTLI